MLIAIQFHEYIFGASKFLIGDKNIFFSLCVDFNKDVELKNCST